MPKKKKNKRIQLDKPNEQAVLFNEKLKAVEDELKKNNPGFKLPEQRADTEMK